MLLQVLPQRLQSVLLVNRPKHVDHIAPQVDGAIRKPLRMIKIDVTDLLEERLCVFQLVRQILEQMSYRHL